jgi:hypothetical protein
VNTIDATLGEFGYGITLTSGQLDEGNDFGNFQARSSLSGSVYVDKDNDGIRDPGEVGIPGVTVWLMGVDSAGNPVGATVVTDANGDFAFVDMLPGLYDLIEIQPSEFVDGTDREGSLGGQAGDDIISGILVGPDEDGVEYWFGERGLKIISKRDFLTTSPPDLLDREPGSGVTSVNPSDAEAPAAVTAQTQRYDVNEDTYITAADALVVVNVLNGLIVSAGESGPVREDVNGDGIVTPRDALMVINYLNGFTPPIPGEGEFPVAGEGEFDEPLDTRSLAKPQHTTAEAVADATDADLPVRSADSTRVGEPMFSAVEESLAEDEVLDVLARDVAGQWLGVGFGITE